MTPQFEECFGVICPFLTFLCVGWFFIKVVTTLEERRLIFSERERAD